MNIPLHQRGAAALGVTFLLLFVLTLVVGFASRNLVFEQRSSANQARSTQAFEAAKAGLQWAQAMLNSAAARRSAPTAIRAPRSGMVQLLATGCDHFASACLPGSPATSSGGASAAVQVLLELLPALATGPIAALTASGEIAAEGALTLVNTAPDSGGLTAQAGGTIALPLASLATLPESSAAASVAALDSQLAAVNGERLLTRWLGLDRDRWQQLPDTRRLDCLAECSADLAQAIGPDATHPLAWITGDLRLDGLTAFGSAKHPVLLVVEGQIHLGGGVQIHGAIVGLGPTWDTSGSSDAQVHGALVALGNVSGNGTPTIVYDAGVLARLQGQRGSFTRVPGSWRDF